jgi:hypothetical protein
MFVAISTSLSARYVATCSTPGFVLSLVTS